MALRYIPSQNMEGFNAGPFRVTMRRWEHLPGQVPTYAIEIWDGFTRVLREELIGTRTANERWRQIPNEVAVMVAKRALGLSRETTWEDYN